MLIRLLLTSLIALLVAPALAAAQTTEPVGTVATGDDEVARAYDNPNVYFDALSGIMAFGQIHEDPQSARSAMRTFPTVFAASISAELESETDAGFTMGELEEAETAPLGEQSAAHLLPFTMFGAFEGEYGMLLVRQGTWVQIMLGFGIGEVDAIADLHALAESMLPRWPSDDPIAVREDGLRTGGIFAMMPNPEDLPAGFVVDDEFEEGPAPTTDEIAPAGTAAPAAPAGTPAHPTVEALETLETPEATAPDRALPLLPTLPPESEPEATPPPKPGATAEPDEGLTLPDLDVTATAPPPAPVATPASINPRLATPFDLTVEIILPVDNAEIAEDGTCQGRGLLEGLAGGATLTLREAETGQPSVAATIAAPGMIAYDTELRQEVCYLAATFAEVPPRAAYTLLAGESVLGRYTFEEVTAEETLLVVLADDPDED